MPEIKILIVEDDMLIAEDMSGKLEKAGYKITAVADNCNDALESAKNDPPDLVFLDIIISGKEDGIETARRLKAIDHFPVIFLSNLHDKKTLEKAHAVKPANYLTKPFTEHQLMVSIQQALFNISENREAIVNQDIKDVSDTLRARNTLFIRDNNGNFRKQEVADILYLEADRAYCTIYTRSEKFVQSSSMAHIREKIGHPDLVQVSRSCVVNINSIDQLKGNLLIIGENEIKIGDQYKEDFLQQLNFVK